VRAGFAARTPSGKDVIVEAVTAYDDWATSGAAGRRRSKSGGAHNVRNRSGNPAGFPLRWAAQRRLAVLSTCSFVRAHNVRQEYKDPPREYSLMQ